MPFASGGLSSGDRTASDPLAPLLAALQGVRDWMDAEDVSWVVIGGVAASLLGRPRTTRDVDLLILSEQSHWAGLLNAGARFGFKPRIDDTLGFARESHVILVEHEPTGVEIDLIVGSLPFEHETVADAHPVTISGVQIPLPTAERLVVMKAIARRPRDIADIESVLDAHPNLDRRFIRRWVAAFAEALDSPDILENLELLFRRRR